MTRRKTVQRQGKKYLWARPAPRLCESPGRYTIGTHKSLFVSPPLGEPQPDPPVVFEAKAIDHRVYYDDAGEQWWTVWREQP